MSKVHGTQSSRPPFTAPNVTTTKQGPRASYYGMGVRNSCSLVEYWRHTVTVHYLQRVSNRTAMFETGLCDSTQCVCSCHV